jgi:hypothetical protein
MSFIPGKILYDCWFDMKISKEERMACRTRALEGIASAMAELGRFSFSTGGALTFDQDGNVIGPGPIRLVDNQAMLKRLDEEDHDEDETALYFEAGHFPDTKSYYFLALDRAKEPEQHLERSMHKLLRMFLSWIPETQNPKFVLAHPDFDIQNVLVAEDGTLQGLIDWDGVAAVPRPVGNERYPSWLTRDWDLAMYAWTEDMEKGIEPDGLWEDSPDTLASHRKEYNDLMQRHNLRQSDSRTSFSSITQKSLYINLLIAAENPLCTFEILDKFVSEIVELAGKNSKGQDASEAACSESTDDFSNLTLFDVTDELANEDPEDKLVNFLRKGFEAPLNRG